MSFTVSYDAESNIITTTIQGVLDTAEATRALSATATLAKEHNCLRFIGDYREAILALSILDLYDLSSLISEQLLGIGGPAAGLKRAMVVARKVWDFDFYETASRDLGNNLKAFLDLDEARQWLLS